MLKLVVFLALIAFIFAQPADNGATTAAALQQTLTAFIAQTGKTPAQVVTETEQAIRIGIQVGITDVVVHKLEFAFLLNDILNGNPLTAPGSVLKIRCQADEEALDGLQVRLQQNLGVQAAALDANKDLIAPLTTSGASPLSAANLTAGQITQLKNAKASIDAAVADTIVTHATIQYLEGHLDWCRSRLAEIEAAAAVGATVSKTHDEIAAQMNNATFANDTKDSFVKVLPNDVHDVIVDEIVKIDAEARVVARVSFFLLSHLDDVLLGKIIAVIKAAFNANAGAHVDVTSVTNNTSPKRNAPGSADLLVNISLTPGTGIPSDTAKSYNDALANPNVTKQANDMAAKLSEDIAAGTYQQNLAAIAAAKSQIAADQTIVSNAYNASKEDYDNSAATILAQGDIARKILATAKTIIDTIRAVNILIQAKIELDRAQIRASNFTLAVLVDASSETLQAIKSQYNEAIKNGAAGNATLTGNNSVTDSLTSDYKAEALRLAALTLTYAAARPIIEYQDAMLSADIALLQARTAAILSGVLRRVADIRSDFQSAVEQENFRDRVERAFKVLFAHVVAVAQVEYSNETSANYTLKIHVEYQQDPTETNDDVKANLTAAAGSVCAQWLGTTGIIIGAINDPTAVHKRSVLQQNNTYVVPATVSDPNGATFAPPSSSGSTTPPSASSGSTTPPTSPSSGSTTPPPPAGVSSPAASVVFSLLAFVVAVFFAQRNM